MPIILGDSPRALMVRMVSDLAQLRDPWARHWLVMRSPRAAEWRGMDTRGKCWAGVSVELYPTRSRVACRASGVDALALWGPTWPRVCEVERDHTVRSQLRRRQIQLTLAASLSSLAEQGPGVSGWIRIVVDVIKHVGVAIGS